MGLKRNKAANSPCELAVDRMIFRPLARLLLTALGAAAMAGAAQAGETSKAAREAYNSGDMARAALLASSTGDRWTSGLVAYRTKRYPEALDAFSALAKSPAEDPGRRGSAAFWAAKSAEAAGRADEVDGWLKQAAKSADGLYGLLARSRLGLEGASALARRLPVPALTPDGGFTQDKALIYALVKKESGFNASARAGVHHGLMQISADTARRLGGSVAALTSAGGNLKLGQAYVAMLMTATKGDLIKTLAGYNMGPDKVMRATAALGPKADALLLLESLPGESVRGYVRKVLADYWGYRVALKQDAGAFELAALAGG